MNATKKWTGSFVTTSVLEKAKTEGARREYRRRMKRLANAWRKGWSVGYPAPHVGIRRPRKPRRVRLGNSMTKRQRWAWVPKKEAR